MPRSRKPPVPSDNASPNEGAGGALAFYMAEARKHKVMTTDEERALAYKIRAGGAEGIEARNEFVRRNMRLVVTIARKYACADMPLPDLVQEGNIGLMRALEKFDPDRGFKFSTYASWWVRQAITRAIHNAGAIRIPAFMAIARHQLTRLERKATATRPVTDEEIKGVTGVSDASLAKLRSLPVLLPILDSPLYGEDGVCFLDTVADTECAPEKAIEYRQFRESVEGALYDVSDRDREILFAWLCGDNFSLEAQGSKVGLTRERVRQILLRVFAKLRVRVQP